MTQEGTLAHRIGELLLRKRWEGADITTDLEAAQADPDTATFKVLFTSWQEAYGKMIEALERIKVTDSDKAGKLQGAIRAVVEGMT